MKIKSCILVAAVALALTSCGNKSHSGLPSDDKFPVMTIGESSADMQTTYPATIKGIQDVEVRPKISGFITKVFVHEGQTVSAGQVLFTIDSETYVAAVRQAQAALNTAKAQLNTARLTYENNKKLFDQHIIGQYELSTAQNSYATAKASVAQAAASLISAKETLSWCTVKAPSAGVIGSLPYKVGALVNASTSLTTVSNISTMEVYFSMSEADILSLSKTTGSAAAAIKSFPAVKLQLADGTIYNQPGRVVKMTGVIDPSTGAYTLIAHFANPSKLLKSGGAGQIVIPRSDNNAIVIPQECTSQVQDKYFVYVLDNNNKAHYTEIKIDPENNGKTYVVTSGLKLGDRVITKGITKLSDGMKVTPITEQQYEENLKKAEKLAASQDNAADFAKAMQSK